MSGLKGLKLGVLGLGIIAALIGGLILTAQVSAQGESVSIGDATAAPGGEATVELSALGIGDPGLGAWTIDVSYDNSVVSVSDCAEEAGSVCNPAFDDSTVRVTGASATGHEGDTVLAGITFECGDAEGTSDLTVTINVLADATVGDPQDIAATTSDGSITCAEPEPDPTATTGDVVGPPDVGTGFDGSSSNGSLLWLVGLLAVIGAAGIAGFGALRIRSRA